jgi:tetratricopeptide (TPR) repeat protein
MSSRASTRTTLARVRKAQGRYDEAEALLREAVEIFDSTEYRAFHAESRAELAGLLRDRGREDEAAAFETRADALAPESSPARIA